VDEAPPAAAVSAESLVTAGDGGCESVAGDDGSDDVTPVGAWEVVTLEEGAVTPPEAVLLGWVGAAAAAEMRKITNVATRAFPTAPRPAKRAQRTCPITMPTAHARKASSERVATSTSKACTIPPSSLSEPHEMGTHDRRVAPPGPPLEGVWHRFNGLRQVIEELERCTAYAGIQELGANVRPRR
jgi:hypothetical protein